MPQTKFRRFSDNRRAKLSGLFCRKTVVGKITLIFESASYLLLSYFFWSWLKRLRLVKITFFRWESDFTTRTWASPSTSSSIFPTASARRRIPPTSTSGCCRASARRSNRSRFSRCWRWSSQAGSSSRLSSCTLTRTAARLSRSARRSPMVDHEQNLVLCWTS